MKDVVQHLELYITYGLQGCAHCQPLSHDIRLDVPCVPCIILLHVSGTEENGSLKLNVSMLLAKVPTSNLVQLELSLLRLLILLIIRHFLAIVANVSLVVYCLWHPC
jgi:hypothetical protein